MYLLLAALLLALWAAPLVDHSSYINLYDGCMRSSSTVFGYELSNSEHSTAFSQLAQKLGAGSRSQERWVVCYSYGSNLFGATVLKSNPRYSELPQTLGLAAAMLMGRRNKNTGILDKLPLNQDGQRAFVERMLEAGRTGKDAHGASDYLSRSTAVLWTRQELVGADGFPTVSAALNDAVWQANWEVLIR